MGAQEVGLLWIVGDVQDGNVLVGANARQVLAQVRVHLLVQGREGLVQQE
jgi:hypothetical protein